jgi:protein-S-isoprenylcysteine O-methyltransferase Ste14
MIRPLEILFITWFVCERLFTRRSGAGATSKDRYSFLILVPVQAICIGLAISIAIHLREYTFPANEIVQRCGLGVFALGFALRFYSVFYLGRFFTTNVAIASDHRVIDTGPYRYVRHPSYTGLLLIYIGFGLALGNWISLLVLIIPIYAAFLYRIHVEETALAEALGEPYRNYMKKTKRLIPMVY